MVIYIVQVLMTHALTLQMVTMFIIAVMLILPISLGKIMEVLKVFVMMLMRMFIVSMIEGVVTLVTLLLIMTASFVPRIVLFVFGTAFWVKRLQTVFVKLIILILSISAILSIWLWVLTILLEIGFSLFLIIVIRIGVFCCVILRVRWPIGCTY